MQIFPLRRYRALSAPFFLFPILFFGLIFSAIIIFLFPFCYIDHRSPAIIDALFSSSSAVSHTGLWTTNLAVVLSPFGKIFLLFLIQTGGILTLFFGLLFVLAIRVDGVKTIWMRSTREIYHDIDEKGRRKFRYLFKFIIIAEATGTILLFSLWPKEIQFSGIAHKIFFSFFHAVSAFNNCGFTLLPDGFSTVGLRNGYIFQLGTAGLMLTGSFGVFAFMELFSFSELRKRLASPKLKPGHATRITVVTGLIVLITGAGLFYFLERRHTLIDVPSVGAGIASLFTVISARGAGYQNIPFHSMVPASFVLLLSMIVIGSSPISTGGGFRTTTVWLLLKSAVLRLFPEEIGESSVAEFRVTKRISKIMFFSISTLLICILLLMITHPNAHLSNISFAECCAFFNNGFAGGIPSELNLFGKLIIIFSMALGRVISLILGIAYLSIYPLPVN